MIYIPVHQHQHMYDLLMRDGDTHCSIHVGAALKSLASARRQPSWRLFHKSMQEEFVQRLLCISILVYLLGNQGSGVGSLRLSHQLLEGSSKLQ